MAVQSLQGPWLNLEEITYKTGMVKNEILYAIQTQQIKPVIYTGNRSFLAYSKNQQGQCIGHAHFRYSGTLAIHPQGIKEIVSDDQTILGFEPVELLCPENIRACSTSSPFNHPLPNHLLQAWQPNSDIFNNGYYIMPLPYEYPDYESAESVIVEYTPSYCCEDTFLTDNAQRFFIRSPESHYVCSGLMTPDTLIRDNISQSLRCHYESKTQLQAVSQRLQRGSRSIGS